MDPVYVASIHEAGHAVVGEAVGFRVAEVFVNEDGSGLCKLEPSPTTPQAIATDETAPPRLSEDDERLLREMESLDDYTLLAIASPALQGVCAEGELLNKLVYSMAGRLAQMRITPEERALQQAGGDFEGERIIPYMLRDGVNEQLFLANARSLAQYHVERHWPVILHLASALMVKRRLTGDEVRAVLAAHKEV